jgi:hypothetical protein
VTLPSAGAAQTVDAHVVPFFEFEHAFHLALQRLILPLVQVALEDAALHPLPEPFQQFRQFRPTRVD